MSSYTRYIRLILVAFLCIIIFAFIVIYVFLFYFKRTINEYNICFDDYNYHTKMCIDKYGDCKISNAYLIVTPIKPFHVFVASMISFTNCKPITDQVKHVMLLVEITLDDESNTKKFILIDKTTYIHILTNFQIQDTSEIYNIRITSEHTLNSVLDKTRTRIGDSKFFNWHFYKNNCQYFIRHLVRTLHHTFRTRKYKFTSKKHGKKYYNKMFHSNYSVNAYYSIVFLYNFFQKYINNVQQHVVSTLLHWVGL
jgi:hypothetical protein